MRDTSNVVFICNTYMQLIAAVQLKRKVYGDETADLVLSDHSSSAESVYEGLTRSGIFRKVLFEQSKYSTYEQSVLADIRDVLELTFERGGRFERDFWEEAAYNRIFYFNAYDMTLMSLYEASAKHGSSPKLYCYEEGITSYGNMQTAPTGGRAGLVRRLRGLLRRPDAFSGQIDRYCFYPEVFTQMNGVSCRKIPHLKRSDRELVHTVNTIFGYDPENDAYPQRYIYFASSSDVDGDPVGETELVLRLADMLGRENILVKMHPRDGRDIYEKYGISVSRHSSSPWEVVQLNQKFDRHVFLTLSSSSVLNASAMLNDDIPTCFLYPMVRGKSERLDRLCEQSVAPTVAALQRAGLLSRTRIANSLSEVTA